MTELCSILSIKITYWEIYFTQMAVLLWPGIINTDSIPCSDSFTHSLTCPWKAEKPLLNMYSLMTKEGKVRRERICEKLFTHDKYTQLVMNYHASVLSCWKNIFLSSRLKSLLSTSFMTIKWQLQKSSWLVSSRQNFFQICLQNKWLLLMWTASLIT